MSTDQLGTCSMAETGFHVEEQHPSKGPQQGYQFCHQGTGETALVHGKFYISFSLLIRMPRQSKAGRLAGSETDSSR